MDVYHTYNTDFIGGAITVYYYKVFMRYDVITCIFNGVGTRLHVLRFIERVIFANYHRSW